MVKASVVAAPLVTFANSFGASVLRFRIGLLNVVSRIATSILPQRTVTEP